MDIQRGVVVSQTNLIEDRKEKPTHWKAALLITAVSLILGGGVFVYDQFTQRQLDNLENDLEELKTSRNYEKIAVTADAEKRLAYSKEILGERYDWEAFFKKLEDDTLPEITFNNMSTQSKKESVLAATNKGGEVTRINLRGTTIGIQNITKQINALLGTASNEEPLADNVRIENIDIKNEGTTGQQTVEFALEITVNPKIFSNNPFLEKTTGQTL